MSFCNTSFFPLRQSQFPIIALNSACGLTLTFPFLGVDCQLVLSKNACFIFPARAVDRGSFLPSWMGRRRISPVLSVIGQVLFDRWIGRRMKWCCSARLLCQSSYWYSTGCLMGSRALPTCYYERIYWEENKCCTPVSQLFLLDLEGKLCNKIYDDTSTDFIQAYSGITIALERLEKQPRLAMLWSKIFKARSKIVNKACAQYIGQTHVSTTWQF